MRSASTSQPHYWRRRLTGDGRRTWRSTRAKVCPALDCGSPRSPNGHSGRSAEVVAHHVVDAAKRALGAMMGLQICAPSHGEEHALCRLVRATGASLARRVVASHTGGFLHAICNDCQRGSRVLGLSEGSRPIFGRNSKRSINTSACRRSSSATIGG